MAKESESAENSKYTEEVAIKGSFLDVFKVVKKDAKKRKKEAKEK